jgi:hypothetical protein
MGISADASSGRKVIEPVRPAEGWILQGIEIDPSPAAL